MVSESIPSYNYGVMTETISHHTSSLGALLERLPPEPHLRGKEFERAAKWFLETDPAYASELREVGRWGCLRRRQRSNVGADNRVLGIVSPNLR